MRFSLKDERCRQVVVALFVLMGIFVLTLGVRAGSLIPGPAGEFFGAIAGLLSTPVFLEISFFCIGLLTVLVINHWRMKRDGDEFVEFEIHEDRNPKK